EPGRVDEGGGEDDEGQDGRQGRDEPGPHARGRATPALGARPLAAEDPRLGGHSRFRTVRPSAITRRTASSAFRSVAGSPSTAIRSATSPGATAPVSLSSPSTLAATDVA